jgi:glucosylceramidase
MKKGIVLVLLIALVFVIISGYTTAVDTLLSQGKPATASSFQAGNEVAKGNDGSLTTRWAAGSAAFPQWWMVDLGASNSLNRVDINWYSSASRSYKYKIEVSADNVTFTTVVDKTGNTATGDTSDSFTATSRYVRITVTGASAGWASAYEFKVYSTSGATPTPGPTATPTPTSGPTATPTPTTPPTGKVLPGKIEAESYDAMSGVATEATSDTGGGLNVGWIDLNDWMDYNVTVNSTSNYRIDYRVASPNATGKVDFRVNSTTLASTTIPNTGGWQAWTTVTANVTLSAGAQTIRLLASVGGWNINWFQGTIAGPTPTPGPTVPPTPTPTPGPTSPPGSTVQVIQTSQAGDRLAIKSSLTFANDDGSGIATITLNPSLTYQKIIGFGGAFTESTAYVLSRISAAKRSEIINAYFSSNGSGYTLCRAHINSCDFSLGNWSYDDTAGDYSLNNFNIQHDTQLIIPLMKDAMAVPGANIKIFSSPWSPPAWMKQNGVMNGGSPLKTDCFAAWALYFSKYIKAYAAQGINIWGVTIQNEPENWPSWEGCTYTAAQERDFLKNYLGPQLKNDPATSAVNIMIHDHNKDHMVTFANTIIGDPGAGQYAWGTAFHWYSGDQFENITTTHNNFPTKHLVFTEGCQEGGPHIGDWGAAERYGHDIIGDLNNWTEGWVDWNMVLDQQGGPNHVGNYCSAPIIADTGNSNVTYNPSYYYLTHFSRYIRPDAVRIDSVTTNASLETTVFKNTDGKTVVTVMNRTTGAINFKIKVGNQIIKPTIPARAMMTFIF